MRHIGTQKGTYWKLIHGLLQAGRQQAEFQYLKNAKPPTVKTRPKSLQILIYVICQMKPQIVKTRF